MATTYVQAERPMRVTSPLGQDVLLLVGFSGHEAISQLFSFELEVLATNETEVAFDKLLGQKITVDLQMPSGSRRYFNGICKRVTQGMRDFTFTAYRLEIVPQFWLLTKRAQSRIFQHLTVPDILKKVLAGLEVTYELQGTWHERDYCVQYRETDFNFASRLMEEEGIYYFFKHSAGGHQMVVANTPGSHPDLPEKSSLIFDELPSGKREEDRVIAWHKVQELRSGKYTLWDHCFELPHKHLEADKTILESVSVGTVNHKQKVANNDKLELYDYQGEYAQRFDGVDKGGGDRPSDLQKIFEDNQRTVNIREQQEAVPGLFTHGVSTCRQMVCGHKFSLTRHFNADGQYLLTEVHHNANVSQDYRAGDGDTAYKYQNTFTCIPFAQPYRPQRVTPKPFVQGNQTAVVVGPPGEEIFTDKYGRVKVQFHWDRESQHNIDSSCWVRVAQIWAGKRWGASFWPRIGQEVVVAFIEGDPDQPIIVGSVYNADQMPPYLGKGFDPKHPNDNKLTGVKSNSTKGGVGFNEWRFDDTKGKEEMFIHGERNLDIRVKNDRMENIGANRHLIVAAEKREQVGSNKHIHVTKDQKTKIDGECHLEVGKDKFEKVDQNKHVHVAGEQLTWVEKDTYQIVGGNLIEEFQKNHAQVVTAEYWLKASRVIIEATNEICLKVGGNFITINTQGVMVEGLPMVNINCGNQASSSAPADGLQCKGPQDPKNPESPAAADDSVSGSKSAPG
jgi:type VI secretion system secreted protein VgrG